MAGDEREKCLLQLVSDCRWRLSDLRLKILTECVCVTQGSLEEGKDSNEGGENEYRRGNLPQALTHYSHPCNSAIANFFGLVNLLMASLGREVVRQPRGFAVKEGAPNVRPQLPVCQLHDDHSQRRWSTLPSLRLRSLRQSRKPVAKLPHDEHTSGLIVLRYTSHVLLRAFRVPGSTVYSLPK